MPIWGLGYVSAKDGLRERADWLIGLALLSSIIGSILSFIYSHAQLRKSKGYIENSGKLDTKQGIWHLAIPLSLNEANTETNHKIRWWTTITRWVVALTPLAAQVLIKRYQIEPFVAIVSFIAANFLLFAAASKIALVAEVSYLEKQIGRSIYVSDKETIKPSL